MFCTESLSIAKTSGLPILHFSYVNFHTKWKTKFFNSYLDHFPKSSVIKYCTLSYFSQCFIATDNI